jgi:hypothetical protein
MTISILNSIKAIEHLYRTGEEPVLVICSDMKAYICKYMRSSSAAYKLACEFIGSHMAKAWQLETPDVAFVKIKQEHWSGRFVQHSITAPALGSKQMVCVVDITPSTLYEVQKSFGTFQQLLKIALFDFWIANEDRNANNANLLYDVSRDRLISIDYGCIFNTATFEYPLSQLTTTDTILWSDLFRHLVQDISQASIDKTICELSLFYQDSLKNSANQIGLILENMPKEWKVPGEIVNEKLQQLFDEKWIGAVWDNFLDCLKENIENG